MPDVETLNHSIDLPCCNADSPHRRSVFSMSDPVKSATHVLVRPFDLGHMASNKLSGRRTSPMVNFSLRLLP